MWNVTINYWAILVAAVSTMVIGSFWYSPMAFLNVWMKELGKSAADVKNNMRPASLAWMFVVAIVVAYILSHFIQLIGAKTLADAFAVAFWAWLGFTLSVIITTALAEARSLKLILITGGYQLVSLLVMAAILFSWK